MDVPVTGMSRDKIVPAEDLLRDKIVPQNHIAIIALDMMYGAIITFGSLALLFHYPSITVIYVVIVISKPKQVRKA